MRHRLALLLLVPGISIMPLVAHAQWVADGVALSTAANDQFLPTIVSDGAGGAIVTWMDRRNGVTTDIYVQRVNSSGTPLWTADGVALCTAANNQEVPTIVTDGAGGAIVTWRDPRNAFVNDIYAQRVNAAGVPLWTADGEVVCAAAFDQIDPEVVSDGTGGAIIAWYDYRNGVDIDIYAQRVSDLGTPQWTADGVALCAAANSQYYPTMASDGAGGAIVAWIDRRSGFVIYSQRVSDLGTPLWTVDGIAVYTAAVNQEFPTIVSDGAGGAIFIWQDLRSGVSYDIYTQRVSDLGTPLWTANGVVLCAAASSQFAPTLVPNGAGGAIVTWYDLRNGANSDIYAQRVNSSGVPEWTIDGVALSTAAGTQQYPTIASDGAGGAIVTWRDRRSGTNLDIYAQRADASGTPQWTANGVAVCTAALDQTDPVIVSDGAGGAIMSWQDLRTSASISDIYALKLNPSGDIPTAVSGPTRGPSLIVGQVYPNPFSGTASMDIELTTPSTVRIEVFDVAGRSVRSMSLRDAVSQRVEFDGRDGANRLLPSGVYFYRVKAAGESITRKMVIAR